MTTRFLKSIRNDLFFLVAGLMTYSAAALTAWFQNRRFDAQSFTLGVALFLIGFLIKSLLEFLTTNKINPYTRLDFNKNNQNTALFVFTIFLFVSFFALLYYLLQKNLLIGVNLLYLGLIFMLFLLPSSRFGKLVQHSFDVIIEALMVAPLMLLLGGGLQGQNPVAKDFLLALPLFLLYIASAIAWRFPDYGNISERGSKNFIDQIGWENGIRLHNLCILLGYLALFAFLLITKTFSFYWMVLLSALISLLEIYLLNRISIGMKPSWSLLRFTAFLLYFSVIYFLIYPIF